MLKRVLYSACLVVTCSFTAYCQVFFPVKDSIRNLYGLKSELSSKWKIKPRFEHLEGEGFFSFKSGDTLGIIASSGKVLIAGKFSHLYYDPYKGNAILRAGDLYGYWDTLGNYILPISKYELSFENGLAYFNSDSTQGFIDKQGKKVIEVKTEINLWDVNPYGYISRSNDKECVYDSDGKRIRCDLDKIIQMRKDMILYIKDGKYGIMSYKGEDFFYDTYERISPFNQKGLSVVVKENNYGLINDKMEIVFPLENQFVEEFGTEYNRLFGRYKNYTSYSVFKKNEYFGVINDSGRVVIEPQYELAMIEGEYLLKYIFKDSLGLLDIRKLKKLPLIVSFDFINDKSIFCFDQNKEPKCGIVNKQGKILVAPLYKSILTLPAGNAIVKNDEGAGIIDATGQAIVPLVYEDIRTLNDVYKNTYQHPGVFEWDNYLYVKAKGEKEGVATESGELIVDTSYTKITVFDEDCKCWFVRDKSNHWRILNSTGEKLSVKLDAPAVFYEGAAVVRKKNKSGIINVKGKTLAPFKYTNIEQATGSLYYFQKNLSWGLLNKKGKEIMGPVFNVKTSFTGQYAFVRVKDSWSILDTSGKMETLLKLKGLRESFNTRMIHEVPVVSFSYNDVKGFDEVSFDLIADHPYSVVINNFILDSKKNVLEKGKKIQEVVCMRDSFAVNVDRGDYRGIGSELLNITKYTFTLNEFTEESKGGSGKVEESCKAYLVREDSLMEITLETIFKSSGYLHVLNSSVLKKLMEMGISVVADTLVFDTQNFRISDEGLIVKIDKRIVPDIEAAENIYLTIPYEEIRSMVKLYGPLKEFYE